MPSKRVADAPVCFSVASRSLPVVSVLFGVKHHRRDGVLRRDRAAISALFACFGCTAAPRATCLRRIQCSVM